MGCWWKDSSSIAIPPTSASKVVGQRNKIGGITFRAALINNIFVTENLKIKNKNKNKKIYIEANTDKFSFKTLTGSLLNLVC